MVEGLSLIRAQERGALVGGDPDSCCNMAQLGSLFRTRLILVPDLPGAVAASELRKHSAGLPLHNEQLRTTSPEAPSQILQAFREEACTLWADLGKAEAGCAEEPRREDVYRQECGPPATSPVGITRRWSATGAGDRRGEAGIVVEAQIVPEPEDNGVACARAHASSLPPDAHPG